jgi:hypothetical protein
LLLRVVLEIAGTLIVLFTLREVFRDIFHPTRSGNLSDAIGRGMSLLLRHTRLRPAVGPLALIAVLIAWILLLCVGFAVLYLGLYPQDFTTTAGVDSLRWGSRIIHCLYFSVGALCTFQTFDLNPRTDWLRLIVAIQGLVGISMITASVSWLVLLYPALARQRATARMLTLATEAEERTGLSPDEHDAAFLIVLEQNVVQARLDLVLFPILFHFYALTPAYTLSAALPTACRFAREAMYDDQSVKVRLCGTKLQIALEDLAKTLSDRVLSGDRPEHPDVEAIFHAYAERER